MSTRRMFLAARTAGEYLSATVGAVAVVIDTVAIFFGVPPIAKWIVTGVTGLFSACWGAFSAWRDDRQRELRQRAAETARAKRETEQRELLGLAREMRGKLEHVHHKRKEHHHHHDTTFMHNALNNAPTASHHSVHKDKDQKRTERRTTCANDSFFNTKKDSAPVILKKMAQVGLHLRAGNG